MAVKILPPLSSLNFTKEASGIQVSRGESWLNRSRIRQNQGPACSGRFYPPLPLVLLYKSNPLIRLPFSPSSLIPPSISSALLFVIANRIMAYAAL
jgi:hypothetical protein